MTKREGTLTWTIDGEPMEVGPGRASGAVHCFDNFGAENAKQLSVVRPAITGPAYFREASEVVNAAAGGPPERGQDGRGLSAK